METADRRGFPVLGSSGATIDWQLVADHGKQAKTNHSQTVERLAERGGLSWCELHAVLHNRPYQKMDTNQAMLECRALERAYLAEPTPFQERVHSWVLDFFPEHGVDVAERARRFLEEALELAQAVGLPAEDAQRILWRTYSRPPGQPHQEVGGTMVSLAALCAAVGLDQRVEGWRELARISAPGMREQMRAKQAQKIADGVGI